MRQAWLILSALLLIGCGAEPSSINPSIASPGQTKKLRIAVIPKGTSHEFWKSVHAGSQQAAQELGDVEILWQGPALESDINRQMEIVRTMIQQQVDGIVLAPSDSATLVEVVKEANDAKIPVVIFDSGLNEGAEIVSYVATDNEQGGALAGQRLAELLGEQGNVILMRYRVGSESTHQREEGFLKEMAKHEEIKVLSHNQYALQGVDAAKAKAEQLLLKFQGDVNGFLAVCESNAEGALLALESPEFDNVKFIAFDPSDQLIDGLEEGKVHGIILQDPVRMGYLSVQTMLKHLQGDAVEKRIATGEHLATKENMHSVEMQKLLKPVIAE